MKITHHAEKSHQVQRVLWVGFVACAMIGIVYLLATTVPLLAAAPTNPTLSPVSNEHMPEETDTPAGYPGPVFDPPAQANFGQPVQTVTHTVYLENQTEMSDSFTLDLLTGHAWNATLSPTHTNVLANGERTSLTVVVEVPPGVTEGDMDSLEVLATADNDVYTNTTTLDTAVICEPHLVFRGDSTEEIDTLDDIYQYAGQKFAYLLVHVDRSIWYYHINATISGYNPNTDTWDVIAQQISGEPGLVVHQTAVPPVYTKIRIKVDDGSNLYGKVWYHYQFALCREPVVGLQPTTREGYGKPDKTIVYSQTLTNWTMTSTAFDLAADSTWPATFWYNGSQITNTGVLNDLDTFNYEVHVTIPSGTDPGAADVATIQATAVSSPTIQASSVITTYATGDLAYITLSSSDLVAVVDSAFNTLIDTIDVGASGCSFPWRAAITPDGRQVYVSCRYSANVMVIDTSTHIVTYIINYVPPAEGIAFSRDGQYAFLSNLWNRQIVVVDTTNFSQLSIDVNGYTRNLVAHPLQDLIYVTSSSGEILVLDTTTLAVVDTIDMVGEPWDVAISPDGRWLYTGDRWGSGLSVIDLNTNSVYATLTDLGYLMNLDISPDGTTLYASEIYSGIQVIDTATLIPVTTIEELPGFEVEMAATCDGNQLYTSNGENYVPIVDTMTYSVTLQLPMPGYGAAGIAICPQNIGSIVILSPPAQQQQGVPEESLTYETTLRNETGQTDTFTVTLSASTWNSELSSSSIGPLADGEASTVVVTVTIPTGANWYDTSVVTVTATSITSPTVYSDTAVLTSEAYAPPQFSLYPESVTNTQFIGDIVPISVTLQNGNGVTGTFALRSQILSIGVAGNAANSVRSSLMDTPELSEYTFGYIGNNWTLEDLQPYDGVIVAECDSCLSEVESTALRAFYESGHPVLLGMSHLYNESLTTRANMFAVFGISDVGDSNFRSGTVNPYHPIGEGITSLNSICCYNDYYVADTATWVVREDSGQYFVMANGTSTVDSVIFGENLSEWLTSGNLPLVRNAILWMSTGSKMDDWWQIQPISGTVGTNNTTNLALTLNATGQQPGLYTAVAVFRTNDPRAATLTLPISMTVAPTASMGWVEGYITDNRFGTPLAAVITAQGQPYTITTASDGYYKLWLEAGNYTLQVTADGYVSQTLPLLITAQQGVLQDVALVEDVPVFSLTPSSIDVTLLAGDVITAEMALYNDGPSALTFYIDERDTTPGLSLLSAYARTDAEMSALQAQALPDTYHESAPTIAPIPTAAFANLQGTTNLLTWVRFTDYDQEYENTLNAIAQYTTFNLTETDTEDPAILAPLLAEADVFLIPEQEYNNSAYFHSVGVAWASVLQTFVHQGGTILGLDYCSEVYELLEGAGLINSLFNGCGSYYTLEVADNQHPLAQNVPASFLVPYHVAFYTGGDNDVVIKDYYDNTVVFAEDIGAGHVALIGFDYYAYNNEMARILANGVQWYNRDIPWLITTPMTGIVPGYDALSAQITFDTTHLQPGFYTANLIADTNDPYTPTQVLSISMDVQPTTTMGQVVGTISDAWTGSAITATVQLQGVYTATADPGYAIWAEAGDYTLTAFADGYMTATVTVSISVSGIVTQNLALVPAQPRLEGMPDQIHLSVTSGSIVTHSFTLSNTGPVPLPYAWHEISTTNRLPATPLDLVGKKILYDRTHSEYGISGFSYLIDDMINAGGVITENYTTPVTADVLRSYDVLWVNCCGYTNWSEDELTAVSNWLAAGGSLFLSGGNSPASTTLANWFDIYYIPGSYVWGVTTNIQPHPTTEGINEVYLDFAPNVLIYPQSAEVLVYDQTNNPIAIAQEQNSGRIVVVTSYSFSNSYINYNDNRTFAMNIIEWLASPIYTDVPWTHIDPISGTISAYENQDYTMEIDATDLIPGTYEMMMVLTHDDPAQASPIQMPVTVDVVAPEAVVSAIPDKTANTAVPGHRATYHIVITNMGSNPDSFTIAAEGSWNANLSAVTTGELASGESFTVTVDVMVPAAANSNSSDVTTIHVTSTVNSSVTVDVALTTTAEVSMVYLPIIQRP